MSLKTEVGSLSAEAQQELKNLQRSIEVQAHAIEVMTETALHKALPYLVGAACLVIGGAIGAWWF